ncbi:hypothetical protein [Cupriavidus basilensis]|uniref:hypothetical protein n=1 Tax=Cupriavidus basilensis TaxID=68895 RepID=UPI0005B928CD|nr:hypothetical protein [Cupriavidus basilensis]
MTFSITQLPAELVAQLGVRPELTQSMACAIGALCAQGPASVKAVVSCSAAALGRIIEAGVVMTAECAGSEGTTPPVDEQEPIPENKGDTAISDALNVLSRELSERRLSRDIFDTRVVRTSFGGVAAVVVKVGEREP